jgi:hypothetical protein
MSSHAAGAYTTTVYVMVDIVKGGRRAPPPPSTGWAHFSIMMETLRQKEVIATLCKLCGFHLNRGRGQ